MLGLGSARAAGSGAAGTPATYCVTDRLDVLGQPAWGTRPPPWAPGRREEISDMQHGDVSGPSADQRLALLSKIDILADLSEAEMDRIVEAAPARTFAAGELLYSPHRPVEALFLLKRGRVRVFRVSADGRALTTGIVEPGTMFGEMVLLGQQMHDNYAEALDEAFTCVMSAADVHRLLLSDPRVAARIVEILGSRLVAMERRLSEVVFFSVPQRVAATLCALIGDRAEAAADAPLQIQLTHGQIAALAGASRETTTKALGELADHGALRLGRGRITVTDPRRLAAHAGTP